MVSGNSNLIAFLGEAGNVLGSEHVVVDGERLEELSKDPVYTCQTPEASVFPGDTSEVSRILELASQYGIAIWVYSTALNWGYCNTTGDQSGVLMILSRMNRIIEVNEELAYVEIEPGVTYAQLSQYLRDHDIPLWIDCTGGPPSGSVLGNAIDRGFGVTPYSDHFEQICGFEFVLADGSVMRSGGFGESRDTFGAWHTYRKGAGPVLDGLFSQSNFGVVVRAGFWLMPEPEHLELASLPMRSTGDLPEAIDTMRDLLLSGDLPGKGRFTNDLGALTMLTQVRDEVAANRTGVISDEDLKAMRERHGIAEWSIAYGLYGSKPMVKTARKQTIRKLKRFGKLTFADEKKVQKIEQLRSIFGRKSEGFSATLGDFMARKILGCSLEVTAMVPRFFDLHRGIPNESVVRRAYFYGKKPRPEKDVDVARDDIGLMWFVPLLPFRGQEITDYLNDCAGIFRRHGFDPAMSITPVNPRTVVTLMIILYQRTDTESCNRAGALYDELQTHALERGYQQFRCGHPGWDRLFDLNPELKQLHETLKEALDPKGILAPGRYGIGSGEGDSLNKGSV